MDFGTVPLEIVIPVALVGLYHILKFVFAALGILFDNELTLGGKVSLIAGRVDVIIEDTEFMGTLEDAYEGAPNVVRTSVKSLQKLFEAGDQLDSPVFDHLFSSGSRFLLEIVDEIPVEDKVEEAQG